MMALLALLLYLKRGKRVSVEAGRQYLRQGAMVIDVRSAGEFTAGHLPMAVNIPLSEVEAVIARRVSNKQQVLLLHCQSGSRSAVAVKKLKSLGYAHAFNLGGYGRAAEIVGSR